MTVDLKHCHGQGRFISSYYCQIFARKLIRISAFTAWIDIETEFRAIKTLYTRGPSKYLVEVFGYGRLNDNVFFIDMEPCGQDLHVYINGESAVA